MADLTSGQACDANEPPNHGIEKFGLRILTPGEFLKGIGGLR
jgi:hypothetical protein